jgi:hypothetical protein
VLILQHESTLDLQEAITRAVAMVNAEMRGFLRLKTMMTSFGVVEDAYLHRYLEALEQWMVGDVRWAQHAPRYQPSASAAAGRALTEDTPRRPIVAQSVEQHAAGHT